MKKIALLFGICLPLASYATAPTETPRYYGTDLCASPQYKCIKINRGESWDQLFPNEEQRDLVQRINRSYNYLWPGKEIAVPVDLEHVTMLDLSPFPLKIEAENERQIIVDQDKLAWGAYNEQGDLVRWGPVASGSDKCSDSNNSCRTLTGIFRVFSKESVQCKSDVFPIGKGGAKMPYCMYFHKGFALHGSDDIPGYRASHGCVRMFVRDAKWLNEEFVTISKEENNYLGTKVTVRPVTAVSKFVQNKKGSKTMPETTPKATKTYAPTSASGGWADPDQISVTVTERMR